MIEIRYVQLEDIDFWFTFDKHLPKCEFEKKVRDKQGYILLIDNKPIGLLRFNLFWDNIPFCNMLLINRDYQRKSFGKKLMEHWESDMKTQGYDMLLISTQTDENAQHFYRKLGYMECGCLIIDNFKHKQPMEMFFVKNI